MITKEQMLIEKVTPSLPIIVYPEREILGKLQESFEEYTFTLKTELEVNFMIYMGESGGITCEIIPVNFTGDKTTNVLLCSITHFRVKRGEPYYEELEKYRIKRIRKLQRQNKNPFF